MLQTFLLRKMLRKQGVPDAQIEMFVRMFEKNPELFKKIAKEAEDLTKGGMSQQAAGMVVMKKYQAEIKKLAE